LDSCFFDPHSQWRQHTMTRVRRSSGRLLYPWTPLRVWKEMQAAGVAPDQVTEYQLARAFSAHPMFAAELICESRDYRDRLAAWLKETEASAPPPLSAPRGSELLRARLVPAAS
jgi:hypothetical protein